MMSPCSAVPLNLQKFANGFLMTPFLFHCSCPLYIHSIEKAVQGITVLPHTTLISEGLL